VVKREKKSTNFLNMHDLNPTKAEINAKTTEVLKKTTKKKFKEDKMDQE